MNLTPQRTTGWLAAGTLLILLFPLAIVVLVTAGGKMAEQAAANDCGPGGTSADRAGSVDFAQLPKVDGWSTEQVNNAAHILAAGAELRVPRRAQYIAVMTAIGESSLRVLNHGDSAGPDSRGLFQQRSTGWGTLKQRMDPQESTKSFLRALLKVKDWEVLAPTMAAHRTQRNADPNHYTQYWSPAVKLANAIFEASGGPVVPISSTPSGVDDPYNLGNVKPQTRRLVNYLAPKFNIETVGGYRASARDPGGHPSGLAADFMVTNKRQGDALAEFAKNNARLLGIDYIIWWQHIWSADRADEGWRPMEDRGSPTLNHKDHPHINVLPDAQNSVLPDEVVTAGGIDAACDTNVLGTGGQVTWPVPASLKGSDRQNYGDSGSNWSSYHQGTDFSVACGTPVLAAHGGTVELDRSQGWAGPVLVKVATGPSSLTTWYAHMRKVSVKDGQTVAPGDRLGDVGSRGNSTGCHLHFEVHPKNGGYNEDDTNPTTWLAKNVGKFVGGAPPAMPMRLATFNALGHSHTVRGGNKPGWASSPSRITRAAKRISARRTGVLALQEFQAPQAKAFRRAVGQQYGLEVSEDNAIAWRLDAWTKVRSLKLVIPYFNGDQKPMPIVQLRNRRTGQLLWVISIHNPADTARFHGQARYRREAERRERAAVIALASTGVPVALMGDFNDRGRVFCHMTAGGLMSSPHGGTTPTGKRCRPPRGAWIDWIFLTGRVKWQRFHIDRSYVRQGLADHPLVIADVGGDQ